VRIPSGDLAPARKHRRYGRRHRSPWPAVIVVLLVLAVAGGAYAYTQRDDDEVGSVAQASPCPSPAPVATRAATKPVKPVAVVLPAPGKVRFRLLNGTGRDGLAHSVGDALARRGFQVAATGNAPKPLAGASRVTFGPGGRQAATLVALHVGGAQLLPVPAAPRGAVDLTLGSSFVRLRTPAEVHAAAVALAHPVAPAAKPRPAPSASCR
jgi:hypothetical protein